MYNSHEKRQIILTKGNGTRIIVRLPSSECWDLQHCALQNLADTRARADRAVPDRPGTRRPLTRAATSVGSSVVEDRQVELVEALGVGEYVDCDDLPARDREAEDDT